MPVVTYRDVCRMMKDHDPRTYMVSVRKLFASRANPGSYLGALRRSLDSDLGLSYMSDECLTLPQGQS